MMKFGPSLLAVAFFCDLAAFAAVFCPTVSVADSRLPPCSTDKPASWTGCQGTYTYSDGGKYAGEFRDGKPNGQGTHTYSDGRKYVGGWRDGMFHGQGTLSYPHSGEYVGEFRDSRPNGQGTYTYPDGRKYVGEWRDGKFNGPGALIYPDGRKDVGEFRDNAYVEALSTATVSAAPSTAAERADDNMALLVSGALLSVLGGIAASFVMRAKPAMGPAADAGLTGVASLQSRLDEALRALLESADDLSVSDGKLLELRENARRALEELKLSNPRAAKKGFFSFLKA